MWYEGGKGIVGIGWGVRGYRRGVRGMEDKN